MSSSQESASRELLLGKFAIVTGVDIARVRVMMADKTDAEVLEEMDKVQRGAGLLPDAGVTYSATR